MEIEIRPLRPDDDRSLFSSGDVELDRFFRNYAGQNHFRLHVGVTYVASTAGRVVGYVTIAPGSMVIDRLPRRERQRLPAYPLPILRLARLAVATTHQGHGIGSRLVRFALELAREMAERFGCVGVAADVSADRIDLLTAIENGGAGSFYSASRNSLATTLTTGAREACQHSVL